MNRIICPIATCLPEPGLRRSVHGPACGRWPERRRAGAHASEPVPKARRATGRLAVQQDQEQWSCRDVVGFGCALLLVGTIAWGEAVLLATFFRDLATSARPSPAIEVIPDGAHFVSGSFPL